MQTKNRAIIEIKNLSVNFGKNSAQVLNDFCLNVYENDKIAIIGETGSGKSIMLQALLRLLPTTANISGDIIYNSLNLLDLSREELDKIRGCEISYVPQGSGNSLNPLLKIGYQISEPLIVHKKIEKKNIYIKAIELMKKFNIGNEEQLSIQYPHTFSGGMKQRALIAMGISAESGIILADEPTKGLDSKRVKLVEEAFSLLEDKTYICVTHDLAFAKNISDIICIMYSSELFEVGNTEEIFLKPYHPYTEDIINAMPENNLQCRILEMKKETITGCRYQNNCIYAKERCKKNPPMFEVEKGRKVRCWKYATD